MLINFDKCIIDASKHFVLKYMQRWGWDFNDLRDALKTAYKVDAVGKKKYEAYVKKEGSKKLIFVYYKEHDTIFIITGAEGK